MLPTQHRLRNSRQFAQVIRKGKRNGNRYLVIHHLTGQLATKVPLVGFVVPKKAIPLAVNRNRVKRQLRSIIGKYIDKLPTDLAIVIRVSAISQGQNSRVLETSLLKVLGKIPETELEVETGSGEVNHDT